MSFNRTLRHILLELSSTDDKISLKFLKIHTRPFYHNVKSHFSSRRNFSRALSYVFSGQLKPKLVVTEITLNSYIILTSPPECL